MRTVESLKKVVILKLLGEYPFLSSYFSDNNIGISGNENRTLEEWFNSMDEEELEDRALDKETFFSGLKEYIDQMAEFLGEENNKMIGSLTIIPGTNKSGEKEQCGNIEISGSEIIAIVGPTGSGKSRLLADIEWVAQEDTPTGRKILINEEVPDLKWRFSSGNRLVAQLSQNMNFVIDLSVKEFLELHARSRLVENEQFLIEKIINAANDLAGESFEPDTPVTSLSGGQSRALMIADTAILSSSPIILIDEIENAGIDRKKALELLVNEDKIVLMATHDPLLALMGTKRIVINNGGIEKIITTTDEERIVLKKLEKIDDTIRKFRKKMRYGKILSESDL